MARTYATAQSVSGMACAGLHSYETHSQADGERTQQESKRWGEGVGSAQAQGRVRSHFLDPGMDRNESVQPSAALLGHHRLCGVSRDPSFRLAEGGRPFVLL